MKAGLLRARRAMSFGLAVLVVCCQNVSIAYAADTKVTATKAGETKAADTSAADTTQELKLLQEEANLDTRPPVQDAPVEQKQTLLNGNVSKEDARAEALQQDQGAQHPGTVDLNAAMQKLVEAARSLDSATLDRAQRRRGFTLTVGGNAPGFFNLTGQRPKYSPEEFRKMEYGVIGMESLARFDGSPPMVKLVYPTLPAENAGIRKGDLVIKANDYVFKPGDGQRVLWQVVGGKADTPLDITVLRDGQLMTFHLVRMNIEDIPDPELKTTFEKLLSVLGPPQYNN